MLAHCRANSESSKKGERHLVYDQMLSENQQLYPRLFPTEDEFLHHVFFVNGNGFVWRDGEIVEDFGNARSFEERLAESRANEQKHRQEWNAQTAHDIVEFRALGGPDIDAFVADWIERHDYDKVFKANRCTKLYPMCQYATILHIPDDVRIDWLDAAERALYLSLRLKRTKKDISWLKIARQRVNQIRRWYSCRSI